MFTLPVPGAMPAETAPVSQSINNTVVTNDSVV